MTSVESPMLGHPTGEPSGRQRENVELNRNFRNIYLLSTAPLTSTVDGTGGYTGHAFIAVEEAFFYRERRNDVRESPYFEGELARGA